MKIQVLGSGCPTCKRLFAITQQALAELGWKDEVVYTTGQEALEQMMAMGAMGSPVLAVEEKIVMVGFVPEVEKVKKLLQEVKNE